MQVNQRAFVTGCPRFNFIGTESSAGNQSIYGHRQSLTLPGIEPLSRSTKKLAIVSSIVSDGRYPNHPAGCVKEY